MTKDDIIRMALEAMAHTSIKPNDKVVFYISYENGIDADGFCDSVEIFIERFAALVAEAIRAKLTQPEIVYGNTLTFMIRAIFNVVAEHQETHDGYFIADGYVNDFIIRLARVIETQFNPLRKEK